jgi:hypothetical protein
MVGHINRVSVPSDTVILGRVGSEMAYGRGFIRTILAAGSLAERARATAEPPPIPAPTMTTFLDMVLGLRTRKARMRTDELVCDFSQFYRERSTSCHLHKNLLTLIVVSFEVTEAE